MGLENLIAYGVVFGVPLWLVTEELLHRVGPRLKAAPVGVRLRHRAPKSAPAHAHVAGC
jgi:hypothetical protein